MVSENLRNECSARRFHQENFTQIKAFKYKTVQVKSIPRHDNTNKSCIKHVQRKFFLSKGTESMFTLKKAFKIVEICLN